VWAQVGTQIRLGNELDVRIFFPDEVADKFQHPVGLLIRYETHADLGFGAVRNGSLYSWSRVTPDNAVNFKGWSRPQPAGNIRSIAFAHFLQLVRLLELFHRKTGGEEVFHLGFR
jgi:hypothetical protein